ncbi:MAG TPA: hypothetical protein VFU99_08095 [Gaiellaceae bacterium]|nr:hypothetical protein [Gaiellaceae bacterium]
MTRPLSRWWLLLPLVALGGLAVAQGSPARSAAPIADGQVQIVLVLRTATSGTFRMSGALSDAGSVSSRTRVAAGRLQLTQTLKGSSGVIRLRSNRGCGSRLGTWRLLSGTSDYAGITGGGSGSGLPRCAAPTYPARIVYTGSVRGTAPPPLAEPGSFGGSTSQREEVTMTVDGGGRTFSSLRLRVRTPCEGTTITSTVFVSLAGPHAIGADRSFTLSSSAAGATSSVSGRFTSSTVVEGTVRASTQLTVSSTNTTYRCSGEASWQASLPPPAANPGSYCGFTTQGSSICLDVSPSGREVTRLEVGVVVLCNSRTVEAEVRLVFTGIPIGGHLGFSTSSSSFAGLISGMGFVSGLLDPGGGTGASGSVRLQLPVFDHEGTRYTCGVGTAQWEARRQ